MQPQAFVIGVGDELVLGAVAETNCRFAAQLLTAVGLRVRGVSWVRDEIEDISWALKKALVDSEVVVISGGLGPTADDITREGVARALGIDLEFRPDLLETLEARLASLGRVATDATRRQAMVPRGAAALENPIGLAPGLLIERGSRLIALLPGVPFEFCHLVEVDVLGAVEEKFGDRLRPHMVRNLLVTGVPESELDGRIREVLEATTNPRIGLTARGGAVTLRLVAHGTDERLAEELLDETEGRLRALLGADVCDGHPGRPEDALRHLDGLSPVAVADAVTGGRLSTRLTAAGMHVRGWVGDPAFMIERIPGLGDSTGAVEAAAAAAGRLGVDAGVAIWPGEGGFPFVAASVGERAYERVVVPTDEESTRRRCVAVALDLLRRLALDLPPPAESGELESLAALAGEVHEDEVAEEVGEGA